MENRKTVEEAVRENPGINFTGLKRETGLANGTLQYHIRESDSIIKKKGVLLPPGKCDECKFSSICSQKCIHGVLRKSLKRKIVRMLGNGHSQEDIAGELGRDPSTISYHVSRLEEMGVVEGGKPVESVDI